VKQALDFVTQISNVIRSTPKRYSLFQQIRNQANSDTLGSNNIRPLCPTRWTVRSDALNSVLKDYHVIEEELEIIADSNSEVGACANGLGIQLSDFSVFFGLYLSYHLFSAAERTSTALQAADVTMENRNTAVTGLKKYLVNLRKPESFDFISRRLHWTQRIRRRNQFYLVNAKEVDDTILAAVSIFSKNRKISSVINTFKPLML